MKKIILLAIAFSAFSMPTLAEGDAEKGRKLFRRCAACHSLEEGGRKSGPTLYHIFGRAAGSVEGFKYSKAMAASGITWDEETISAYLANPRGYIKGNRMAFPGLKKEKDRIDLIAYLKTEASK